MQERILGVIDGIVISQGHRICKLGKSPAQQTNLVELLSIITQLDGTTNKNARELRALID